MIDRYGQNKLVDFAQKVHKDSDLTAFDLEEKDDLQRYPKSPRGFPPGSYFSLRQQDGVWWLIAPDGKRFYSTAIDCVGIKNSDVDNKSLYSQNLAGKWGAQASQKARERALERMRAWRFNSLGNWTDDELTAAHQLPYVHTGPATWDLKVPYLLGDICDVFHPDFQSEANRAASSLSRNRHDQWLIGYFVDNELPWWNLGYLLDDKSQMTPARHAWLSRLQRKYSTIAKLNQAWHVAAPSFKALCWPGDGRSKRADEDLEQFRSEFAQRFYCGWYRAIKRADPNHLVLGSRIPYPMDEVVAANAQYTDVLSFNHYSTEVGKDLPRYYRKFGKPILIGEYGFDSLDEGLLDAHVKVQSQAERGAGYSYLTEQFAAQPFVIGAHYFQYIDEPLNGRSGDGENSFNGFVRVTDIPYPALVAAARHTNARVAGIHLGTIKPTTRRPRQ